MEANDLICYCFHVSRRKIVNYVKRERPRRASMISDCFGAGTGCGWCIPHLTLLHQEIMGEEVVEGEDISAQDYEQLRLAYLEKLKDGTREKNRHSASASPAGASPSGEVCQLTFEDEDGDGDRLSKPQDQSSEDGV